MIYGLIGKNLEHSYSEYIHQSLFVKNYQLFSVNNIEEAFSMNLDGFNVTNPYKQMVMKHLDSCDPIACATDAVNTVVKSKGKYMGYNTDYYGFKEMMTYNNISFKDKNVIIIGNGASSRTVEYYLKQENPKSVTKLVREIRGDNEDLLRNQTQYRNTDIIINTTPAGMYPNNQDKLLINFHNFPDCTLAIDLIYNPYRTKLLIEAQKFNIKTINGFYMLLMQAKKSEELFLNIEIEQVTINNLYKEIINHYVNIVLVGLPLSGKSYYGKLLSENLNKEWIDTDDKIEDYTKIRISQIFKLSGEEKFREIESMIIKSIQDKKGSIISCGGGVILNEENTFLLKQNGIIIYLNKSMDIINHDNFEYRPLIDSMADLELLARKRYPHYIKASDIEFIISKDQPFDIERLKGKIYEYFSY